MEIVKLITKDQQQTVTLPQDYHLEGNEVYIKKLGNAIILISKQNYYDCLWNSLDLFSDDFMDYREQLPIQKREDLF